MDELLSNFSSDKTKVPNNNSHCNIPNQNDNVPSCSNGGPCDCQARFEALENLVSVLQTELEGLKVNQDDTASVVKIGGYTFNSRDHLMLWCLENLPGIIPVGCFVDV